MSLSTYTGLVSAINDWLDRDDLTARAPDFIRLAEARMNRVLDDPEMEISVTLTGDGAALPDDYGAMVSIGTADGNALAPMSNAEYAAIQPSGGTSRFYTIREGRVYYVPGAANVTVVYRRSLPPLGASTATNWLLDRAPDAYLYGSLIQAEAFLGEDDRLPLWKGAFDEVLVELRADGARRKWGAGPIAPRIKRT